MIPLENSCIFFVHIPRTGGTTIKNLFINFFGEQYVLNEGSDKYFPILESKDRNLLRKYKVVAGHFCYGLHDSFEQRPIYISIVRDPISRTLSSISFIQSNPSHYLHPELKDLSIDVCLNKLISLNEPRLFSNQCEMISGVNSFYEAKQRIDNNYFVVAPFDRINDLITILEIFIFNANVKRLHLNKVSKNFQFSNQSIQLLKEISKEDFKLYDYVLYKFSFDWDYFLKYLKKVAHLRNSCK